MDRRIALRFLVETARMQRRDRWTRARVEARQAREVARLRAHALAHSAFYRRHHAGLGDASLDALPVLRKAQFIEHFDEIVTDPRVRIGDLRRHLETAVPGSLYLGTYRVSTSGGTSGTLCTVIYDAAAWARALAGSARSRAFAGAAFNPRRRVRSAAVVGTMPWLTSAKMMRSFQSRFSPMLHLGAGDPVSELVEQLNAWQPEVLNGFPSIIGVLADEQLQGRLAIRPRLVITGGEVQTPDTRARVAQAWGREPFDQYGSVEVGSIATECLTGRRMHLLDDEAVIEVVDDDGRRVPPGTWGSMVLVTPFWNARQPLIRYVLEDRVRLSADPCPCGRPFPVVDGIQGRSVSLLDLPRDDGGTVRLMPMSFGALIAGSPATWWRATYEDGTVVLHLTGLPDEYDTSPMLDAVRSLLEAHGVSSACAVDVRRLAEIPRTMGGKASPLPATEPHAPIGR